MLRIKMELTKNIVKEILDAFSVSEIEGQLPINNATVSIMASFKKLYPEIAISREYKWLFDIFDA
jgi:hypothetical protein